MDIISAYREVGTSRGAAAMCGTTAKTVRRVIARHEAGGVAPARVARARNYDPVAELVAARVEKTKARISAKRLLPAARAAGYEGSARNFRRLVAAQKALWRNENHRGRRPAVWSPGQHLVIDWGRAGFPARVLRGAGLEPGAVRAVRRQRARRHHAGAAGGVLRAVGRGPGGGAG